MRIISLAAATALLLTATVTSRAQEVDIGPNKDDAAACAAMVKTYGELWTGWQRDFGNGYGDSLHFYDGRGMDMPSVAVGSRMIDGIVSEETTWCYRLDGTLSTIAVSMFGPALDANAEEIGMGMERRGFLYFDAKGKSLQVLGYNADSDGAHLSDLTDPAYALPRPCNPVDVKLTADVLATEVDSVLGDIEGTHPAYTANEVDWCAVAVAPASP